LLVLAPPPTAISPLSLHDALPISFATVARRSAVVALLGTQFMLVAGGIAFVAFARFGLGAANATAGASMALFAGAIAVAEQRGRSEEHTSELQSRENLVCRLLLEK